MSDTPETDAKQHFMYMDAVECVEIDFARKLERERNHWEGRALTAERERDEALNVLREINHWINVAVMRPPTPNEAAYAINTWGDKIRPILEVTE